MAKTMTPQPAVAETSSYRTLRKEMKALWGQLDFEYQQFMARYLDLVEYLDPMKSQFEITEQQGSKTFHEILNNRATLAGRSAGAGLHASMTSPSRPWYKIGVEDTELAQQWDVRQWLDQVTAWMQHTHAQSNLYKLMPQFYESDAHFALAAMLAEPNEDRVIHFTELPIGSFRIANDADGRANVMAREFQMTVRQVVEAFGHVGENGDVDWSNISQSVYSQWENKQWENKVNICHIITPNPQYNPRMMEAKYKRYLSCYYESKNNSEAVLKETGYDIFPVLVLRWKTRGPQDAYGSSSPGIMSLGDVKMLQKLESELLRAIEKQVSPPTVGPEPANGPVSTIPGTHTVEAVVEGRQGIRPMYQVTPDIQGITAQIDAVGQRIDRAYYVRTFQTLTELQGRGQRTVPEIQELRNEKLTELGGVVEQFNFDFGTNLIDLTYAYGLMFNKIPPPPQALNKVTLKIEYISILAQAMKLAGIEGVERFWSFATSIQAGKPNDIGALDKVDTDKLLEHYGDMASVPQDAILPDEVVLAKRGARQQQAADAQRSEAIAAGAGAVKDLAGADMSGDNALTELLGRSKAGSLV